MVLETKRLLLREMKPDDFQALFLVLGNPETMWHYPYTFDGRHVRDWIERNINRYQKDGFGLWAVCLKQSGEMIGDCGLTLQNINKSVIISATTVNERAMPVRQQGQSATGHSATRITKPYIPTANTQMYLPSKQQNPSVCILNANIRMKQMG